MKILNHTAQNDASSLERKATKSPYANDKADGCYRDGFGNPSDRGVEEAVLRGWGVRSGNVKSADVCLKELHFRGVGC